LPEDAFIVGYVGRNQVRKRLDLTLGAFAEWIKRHDIRDAYLYLKIAPTGETGCDIRAVAAYYGPELAGRILVSAPPAGFGDADDLMPLVYSAMDVFLTTTQGEGWGLPTMEAMACGVPCIVPDWSALGEWTEDAAVKVPCTSTALTAPLNRFPYTIGGVPDREATIEALHALYSDRKLRARYRAKGLALTARPEYQWQNVGVAFREALEAAVAALPGDSEVAESDSPVAVEEAA
jgi:glycosyltransferase involved in cell wall biosynthesis